MNRDIRINAERQVYSDSIALYLVDVPHQGPIREAQPVEMKEVEDGARWTPFVNIPMQAAEQLMNDLWNAGIRPSNAVSSTGQKEAMQSHIDDLRALAFKAYKVDA